MMVDRVLLLCLVVGWSLGCTDFMMDSSDKHGRISARTMDFGTEMDWQVVAFPRGGTWNSSTPDGKRALSWRSTYGFVGFSPKANPRHIVEGLNEKGLSASALWLDGTQYANVTDQDPSTIINILDLFAWIIGTCSTASQAQSKVTNTTIWGSIPLHMSVRDSEGGSLVVEFLQKGIPIFYPNDPYGVMTNEPPFNFHLDNMKYLNWKEGLPHQAIPVPGEWYPAERFQRAYMVKSTLAKAKSYTEAVLQATHVLNTVQVPLGAPGTDGVKDMTQFSVIRDHTQKVIYFRTVTNQQLQTVRLSELNLSEGSTPVGLPAESGEWFVDVTHSLKPVGHHRPSV